MEKLHDEITAGQHPLLRWLLISLGWILIVLDWVAGIVMFAIFTAAMLLWLTYQAIAYGAHASAAAWRRSRRQGFVAQLFLYADNALLMTQVFGDVLRYVIRSGDVTPLTRPLKAAVCRRPRILKTIEGLKNALAFFGLFILLPFIFFDALRTLWLSPKERALENYRAHRFLP